MVYGLPSTPPMRVRVEALSVAEDLKEAPWWIQRVTATGESRGCQFRGHDTVLCGTPHVQRLGHRAEVDADARRHARGDRERVGRVRSAEPEELAHGHCRPERAHRSGRMEPLLVVVGVNGFRDLALDFEPGQKRLEEARARCPFAFGHGERCGERRHRRMREQAEDPIGCRGQLRVVEVERVPADAVEQRGNRGTGVAAASARTPSSPHARRCQRGSRTGCAPRAAPTRRARRQDRRRCIASPPRSRPPACCSSRALSMKSTTAPVIDVWAAGVAATAAPSEIPVFTHSPPVCDPGCHCARNAARSTGRPRR